MEPEIYEARITRVGDGKVISIGFYESVPLIQVQSQSTSAVSASHQKCEQSENDRSGK